MKEEKIERGFYDRVLRMWLLPDEDCALLAQFELPLFWLCISPRRSSDPDVTASKGARSR